MNASGKMTATLLAALLVSAPYLLIASPVAVDSPGNYTTATWTNGANAGSGFTPWEFYDTSGPGMPREELFSVGPGNFAPDATWNVGSPTNAVSGASRGFGSMPVGGQVYTKFKIDSVSDLAARVGFRLYSGTDLLYFAQYEDESNSWNLNNTMSWTRADPLAVTEFIWGRSSVDGIDIVFRYDGETILGVTGSYWGSAFPDRMEIFSEYQGIDTGGISLLEFSAPAVPEPPPLGLLGLVASLVLAVRLRRVPYPRHRT